MSFYADKKLEHESAAERALRKKDYSRAFFHTAKAAEFALAWAEHEDGKVGEQLIQDANELIEIATKLKQKAAAQDKEQLNRALKETAEREDEGDPWDLKVRPTTRLADVAGLDEVKRALQEGVILPMKHPEIYARFRQQSGEGVLMYGPPGNGKTFVASAIAGELEATFFPVECARIINKYYGETEKNLKRLFEQARAEPRAVLFFDEVESLLERRGNRKINTVTQFLALTDGVVKAKDSCLLLLAATNRPWRLDDAALRPGRLGRHIYVGLPDQASREAIVTCNLREAPLASDVVFANLAAATDGYSGADLAEICRRAKMSAIRRQLSSGRDELITVQDLHDARGVVKPSVRREQLQEFERWGRDEQRPAEPDDD